MPATDRVEASDDCAVLHYEIYFAQGLGVVEGICRHGDDVGVEACGDCAAFLLDTEKLGGICGHCFEDGGIRDAGCAPACKVIPRHVGSGFAGHCGDDVGGEDQFDADEVGAVEAIERGGGDRFAVGIAARDEMGFGEFGAGEKSSFRLS